MDDANTVEYLDQHSTELIARADFDTQIATAKRYPMHSDARGILRFQQDAIGLATTDQEIAESCLYALRRAGKTIQGPSIRLAEIAVSAYGNCKVASRVLDVGEREVVAQGVFHDLERNVSWSAEVRKRIVRRDGTRYDDDMVVVTSNAACSTAARNAVFKGIPAALIKRVYDEAKRAAIGSTDSLDARRAKLLTTFAKFGVSEQQILAKLDKATMAQVDQDDMVLLLGIYNTLRGGETLVDDEFPPLDDGIEERLERANGSADDSEHKDLPEGPAVTAMIMEPQPSESAEGLSGEALDDATARLLKAAQMANVDRATLRAKLSHGGEEFVRDAWLPWKADQ
jgi:hypothetical protein